MKSFDRLARVYELLERLALGRRLDAVRAHYVERLRGCHRVLIIGDGDGRFLGHLLDVAPQAQVTSIDISAAMLARSRARLTTSAQMRVRFEQADVRQAVFEPNAYDVVVTLFVLDCFTTEEVRTIVRRLSAALAPGGLWIFGDFAVPARGWRRLRARLIVQALYLFFRWQTGISARQVPPSERLITETGLRLIESHEWSAGLLRAALFVRDAPGASIRS